MSDIVERLRERRALGFVSRPGFGRIKAAEVWLTNEPDSQCHEAADEIERLRDELQLCCELKRAYQLQIDAAVAAERERRAKQPLTDEQRMQLFVELSQPCVQADSPSAMFALIVRAVEQAHGIRAT